MKKYLFILIFILLLLFVGREAALYAATHNRPGEWTVMPQQKPEERKPDEVDPSEWSNPAHVQGYTSVGQAVGVERLPGTLGNQSLDVSVNPQGTHRIPSLEVQKTGRIHETAMTAAEQNRAVELVRQQIGKNLPLVQHANPKGLPEGLHNYIRVYAGNVYVRTETMQQEMPVVFIYKNQTPAQIDGKLIHAGIAEGKTQAIVEAVTNTSAAQNTTSSFLVSTQNGTVEQISDIFPVFLKTQDRPGPMHPAIIESEHLSAKNKVLVIVE